MEQNHNRTAHGMGLGILKGKRHIVLLAAVLMIIALVVLHAVAAQAVGFSLENPLSYAVIGSFLLVAVLKLKLLWRFKNSIGKHFKKYERPET
jgi:hypothetical protein